MTDNNLEAFSLAHAKAITDPTVRNLLEAAQAALVLTEAQNDVLLAWTWYAAAIDLASTGGMSFISINSRFPLTWAVQASLTRALKELPDKNPKEERRGLYSSLSQALFIWEQDKTPKNTLVAAQAALHLAEPPTTAWMAWTWTEMAYELASNVDCELTRLGFARRPNIASALSDVKKALANLSQKGT